MRRTLLLALTTSMTAAALLAPAAPATLHRLDGNLRLQGRILGPIPFILGAPPDGGVLATPSATAVQTTGPAPKQLLLSPGALAVAAEDVTRPIAFLAASKYLQVHTAVSVAFPQTLTASGAPAGAAVFSAGGRTGAATETWCPGSGATPPFACTDPAQGGAIHGLLRYTATKSQFGGPARASLGGSVDWAIRGGDPPPCSYGGGANKLCLASMIAGLPVAHRMVGAAFGAVVTSPGAAPPSGKLYVTATAGGLIVASAGPTPGLGDGLPNPRVAYGGPWTTGMLTVSVTNGVFPSPELFILSGSDRRNPAGRGSLSLVAGGLSTSQLLGPQGNRGWLNLEIGPPPGAHVPGVGPAGLAALAVLTGGVGSAFLRHRAGGREE